MPALRPLLVGALLGLAGPLAAGAQQESSGSLEARVWVDRGGDEPVVRRGENVRIYYRTNADAFAAIFRIDTDGRVSLLYPQHPGAIEVVGGGRDYRLLFPDGSGWRVDEDPGMGYLFIVASPEPLDFSLFPYDDRNGWDVAAVGAAVYTDPYVAIDDYVATIVPGWETVPYALDFLTYSVGETYSYPRFLCYDCHTYQRYSNWNPYEYNCATYRVVIYDDPFFYPRYRYAGVNVVYAWPARSLPRYEVTRRAVGDAVAPIVRVRTPAAREAAYAAYKESPVAASPRTASAARRAPTTGAIASGSSARPTGIAVSPTRRASESSITSPQQRPRTGAAPQQVPDSARARPTLQRRPSARLPVRTPPDARTAPPSSTGAQGGDPKGVTPTPSRTSPRAPITRPQAEPRAPQATPSPRPSTTRAPQPEPSSTRPSARREPQASPPATSRAAPSRPTQQQPSSRAQPTPRASEPSSSPRSGSSRPAASPPPSRPQARAAEPPRSAEPRPTVRPRPADPN